MKRYMWICIDLKPNSQPQQQTTEKPKKSKRDVEGPSKIFPKKKTKNFI
jgi:hypothetical protein